MGSNIESISVKSTVCNLLGLVTQNYDTIRPKSEKNVRIVQDVVVSDRELHLHYFCWAIPGFGNVVLNTI